MFVPVECSVTFYRVNIIIFPDRRVSHKMSPHVLNYLYRHLTRPAAHQSNACVVEMQLTPRY
jgi:hypothetical protein